MTKPIFFIHYINLFIKKIKRLKITLLMHHLHYYYKAFIAQKALLINNVNKQTLITT